MSKELVQLCIDTYRGVVANYSSKDSSEVIRKAFVDIMGTDKPDHRQFREHKNEIFAILEVVLDEIIDEGWENNTFFNQFVEYRNLNLGDTNEFYVEDKSMLVISKLAQGHWDLRRQKLNIGDSFTVKTDVYGASVYTDFLRFLAGRIDWGKLVNKIQEAYNFKTASEIYTSFLGTASYLPAQFKHTGTFSEDDMMDIVDHVQASSNYAPIIIAGTKKALKQINAGYTGVNSFLLSENMKDQLNKTGVIDTWNGIPLLEIPQVHAPNTLDFMLDDKKLMILPANTKPIKFVREGKSMIKEISDGTTNLDMSMEYTFLTQQGISCVFDTSYGIYELD